MRGRQNDASIERGARWRDGPVDDDSSEVDLVGSLALALDTVLVLQSGDDAQVSSVALQAGQEHATSISSD